MKKITFGILILMIVQLACSLDINLNPALPNTQPVQLPTSLPALAVPTVSLATPTMPVATPTSDETVTQPQLLKFEMKTNLIGWGITATDLVHTSDGGKTWQKQTPPSLSSVEYASFFALDEKTIWLLIDEQLFYSTDAGDHWQISKVPFVGGRLQFLNAQKGFAITSLGVGAGSEYVAIYTTADGGLSWQQVFTHKPGEQADLPGSGQKSGMVFVDEQNGWITGNIPMENFVYVYRTRDGGVSWKLQEMPILNLPQGTFIETQAPVFFSTTEGVLPARVIGAQPEQNFTVFYFTKDAGETWQFNAATPSSGRYSLLNTNQFWLWGINEDSAQSGLFTTKDSGTSWSLLPTSENLADSLIKLQFVSEQDGFALISVDYPDTVLYETHDGGLNWSILIP